MDRRCRPSYPDDEPFLDELLRLLREGYEPRTASVKPRSARRGGRDREPLDGEDAVRAPSPRQK